MSLSKRRDFGVRVAGDKGRYPDEFVTKRQIVQGDNITITHLDNFDIKISAHPGLGGGGGGGTGTGDTLRDLYVEIKLVRPFFTNKYHYDINDIPNGEYAKYFGTHVFAEIRHNWNLNKPDSFQYSFVDTRTQASPNAFNHVNSLPRVIGVNNNKLRIIGTDTKAGTRTNPYYWVDKQTESGVTKMKDTRLLHFQAASPANGPSESLGDYNFLTPVYRIRITEVRDYEFERYTAFTLLDYPHGVFGA